jgi:carboxyl-terminal processing protease
MKRRLVVSIAFSQEKRELTVTGQKRTIWRMDYLQPAPRKSSVTSWVVIVLLCSAISFSIGVAWGQPTNTLATSGTSSTSTIRGVGSDVPSDVAKDLNFREFWDLWRELKSKYYKQPLDEKKMMYGAMQGLAASLEDPYTTFFEPKSAQEFSDSLQGKFEGIGAEIGIKNDELQVITPLKDTPAERAGLLAGDILLEIDKQDATGMSVEKAVSLIRGPKGTSVTLSIGRYKMEKDAKGKEKKTPEIKEIVIQREVIVVKSVRVSYKGNIAIIEITSFNQDTDELFQQAVSEVITKDVKGVVLDLRNDPGGYLDRAISVASEWIGEQVIVKESHQGKIGEEYSGSGAARLRGIPTIVLVNEGSASASEIVAGALQDYGLAKLVGMKTYGKGSVQDYFEFPDKSAVKITIAEWLTPKDRSINKLGIEPDVQVDRTQEDYHADRDPQLDKALELLSGKSTSTVPATQVPTASSTQ